ncbi:MAG: substrate-binding domain-containing protein [Burkholderiales bacterium]|jgi:phosphate transport system substrate-binding protein|nr:substrate-binding domain-containing protein [Burkholderiales bacterium]
MNLKKYWTLTSLMTFIFLPILLSVCLLPSIAIIAISLWLLPLAAIPLLAFSYIVYLLGKTTALPDTFLSRYGPFIAPILFTLAVWLLMTFVNGGDFSKDSYANYGLIVFLPFFTLLFSAVFSGAYWLLPVSSIAAYLLFTACFAVGTWKGKRFATLESKKALPVLALILVLASVATVQGYVQYHSVLRPDSKLPELPSDSNALRWNYAPFKEGTKLVSPQTPPSLQIDQGYPKLDGAVALIPIYAAAANTIYLESGEQDNKSGKSAREKAVGFSETTPAAYRALLGRQADIIFVGAPSEEQVKEAAERDITYTLTPIAREAFVFLVNEQNPVTNLSVEQIRGIYSGKINNWREVGGVRGKILAFQRNEGSGSQTAMLRIMGETPMRKPLEAEYHSGMGGLIRGVADYRNMDHAIGYSFRYYATVMHSIPGLRLLSIGGIAPTVENIRNGTYPFTDDIYMVTARPLSENARKLHDWFLSDEGQQLIEEVGYVSLRGGTH